MPALPDIEKLWPRDPLRKALQTALAAIAAFVAMRLAGLPDAGWAVISALFVVQPSVGSTLASVAGRIAGAVLGTAIGLACLWLIGSGGWRTVAGLGVAALVVDIAAYRYPGLRYGHVTAGILIVSQVGGTRGDAMAAALDRALAVGIGAVLAGLCAALVFPEPAHRAAERSLGKAFRRCGDLLGTAVSGLLDGGGDRRLEPIHDEIRRHLETAQTMIGRSRRDVARRPGSPRYPDILRCANRLWHTLIIIGRTDVRPLPEDLRSALGPLLQEVSKASGRYLDDLGHAVAEAGRPPDPDAVRRSLAALDERLGRTGRPPAPVAARLYSLDFALGELAGNFEEIAGLFRETRHRTGVEGGR